MTRVYTTYIAVERFFSSPPCTEILFQIFKVFIFEDNMQALNVLQ